MCGEGLTDWASHKEMKKTVRAAAFFDYILSLKAAGSEMKVEIIFSSKRTEN